MNLEKIIEALEDGRDDIFDQFIPKESISYENTMKFLTNLSRRVASSLTLKFLSKFIVKHNFKFVEFHSFKVLYSSEPDFALKVLQLITSKQADKVLDFNLQFPERQKTATTNPQLEESILTEITKMKNLNSLQLVQYHVSPTDLVELGRNLPELKQLRFEIDSNIPSQTDVVELVRQFKNKFNKLEVINLVVNGHEMKPEEESSSVSIWENISFLCLQNIRLVNFVRYFSDASKGTMVEELISQSPMKKLDAIKLEKFASENLKNLPFIHFLMVNWHERNNTIPEPELDLRKLINLKELKNLSCLIFQYLINPACLKFFLENVGKNIQALRLEHYHIKIMNVDLNLIQENCPKLAQLAIWTGVEDSKSLANFTSLRSLTIAFRYYENKKVLLSNILAAPNLEAVRLSDFRVTSQELKATISLVQSKAILTKVETLILRMYKTTCQKSKGATEAESQLFKSTVQEMRQNEALVEVDYVSEPSTNAIFHIIK
ncbi:Hypothetical predicted protein [Cloeon dipterum]|uniref:Uncharacterized protein n=1 Tax=Cloeon dipterum TaxID=197152 RepID=A0A8S1D2M7_9INSE|nr:Hypothetical predicted protein [Cloeon dipterum]